MTNKTNSSTEAIQELIKIVATLRSPTQGCPWDQEQTHISLIPYLLEEAYETVDAIRNKDENNLKEELGDLLLQVVLHAQIAQENKRFCFKDIVENISKKLIRRHPHVFGNKEVKTIEDAKESWEEIKIAEKVSSNTEKYLSSNLREKIRSQPAIAGAMQISKKVAAVGFDWEKIDSIWTKVDEELEELKSALNKKDLSNAQEELGDLIFTLINVGRWYKLSPEEGLAGTNKRFLDRFSYIEKNIEGNLNESSSTELQFLWKAAKKTLKH